MSLKGRVLWPAGVVLVGLFGFISLRATGEAGRRPEDSMLNARATATVPASVYHGGDYRWISNSEMLLVKGFSDSFDRYGLYRWKIATRARTYDTALNTALRRTNIYQLHLSRNSDWVLSGARAETHIGRSHAGPTYNFRPLVHGYRIQVLGDYPSRPPAEPACYSLCRINGTRQVWLDVDAHFMGTRWLADGRHWIELYGRHVIPARLRRFSMNLNIAPRQIQQIRVRNVQTPSRYRAINVPKSALLAEPGITNHLLAINEDRFLTWEELSSPVNSLIVIREISAAATTPRRTYKLALPRGHTLVSPVFASEGDRVLWLLSESVQPGSTAPPADRSTRGGPADIWLRDSIWVSRLDGGGMREIGIGRPVRQTRTFTEHGIPLNPETDEYINPSSEFADLRWAPDGKRFAFITDWTIWTTRAD